MNTVKNIFIIIIIIGLLGVIGYCGYQIYDRLNGNNTEENKTEEKKDVTPVVVEEKEQSNNEGIIKKDILNKVSTLAHTQFTINNMYAEDYYIGGLLTEQRSDNYYKTMLVLDNTKAYEFNKYPKLNDEIKGNYSAIQEKLQAKTAATTANGLPVYIVDADEVKKNYKDLYNEELTEYANEYSDSAINNYIYDSKNNIFYRGMGGKGYSGPAPMMYINNITIADDYVYVNFNIGKLCNELKTEPDGVKRDICDISGAVADTVTFANEKEYSDQLLKKQFINSTNYTKFTDYKIVFKKNSEGNYYFDKVEKVD